MKPIEEVSALVECYRQLHDLQRKLTARNKRIARLEGGQALREVHDLHRVLASRDKKIATLKSELAASSASLAAANQQLDVLKPGGTYAWKTRAEQAEAQLAAVTAQWQERARLQADAGLAAQPAQADPSKCDHDVTCSKCGTRFPPENR